MQTRPRLSRILLAMAAISTAAVVAVGCSSSSSSSNEPLPDAAGLLKESAQTTKNLKSGHLDITVNGKIQGLPIKKLSGDLTNVPATAVQGNATITMGGSDVDAGLVVIDNTLYASLSPNSWLDLGPAADIYDPSTILNPDTGLANILANFSDPKSESSETVNGVDTVKVTGKVSADAVNKLIPDLKVTDAVPGTAWIEKGGDHNLVQAQIDPASGTSIQMVLSNWNTPVTVNKPAM
ncbi:LppX_LprAFG lipoprotein [Mycolicibacterium komossense]|uniref:LppX_LprAFG lipoprotein n=1 Tax=Mycolicibacterium komossense TaxID=1779 RepID=A0ABT3CBU0_9MYCO|nr:LppX_LprAFG lipoprotein [Mycolicibacterium komossense]MCV7226887.1 LppX_LprAFG lipoprotein [Mycolicibacterium komossense]